MKFKRVLAAALSLTLLLSACGSPSSGNNNNEKPNTPAESNAATETEDSNGERKLVELTLVGGVDETLESNVINKLGETLDDNRWTKIIEERLGYKLVYKWRTRDAEQYTQKFNASMASGDIPDLIEVNSVQLKQGVEAGLFAECGGIFDQYATPLLKEIIEEAGPPSVLAATFDGKQYGIPVVDADVEMSPVLYIRKDWLEQTGKSAPKTIDELIDLATAFVEIAGEGGRGIGIEKIPFGRRNLFHLEGFFNAFGAYPEFWIEQDGKLVYGNTTPEFKTALVKLTEMFSAGLIDKEFTVKDGGKVAEDVVSGKLGIFYGAHWAPLWPLQDAINNDPNSDWGVYPIPSVDGSEPRPGAELSTVSWYVTSAESEHPEAVVELMNLFCELTFDPEKQQYAYYSNPEGNNPDDGTVDAWKLSPVHQYRTNKNVNTAREIRSHLESGDPGDLYGESLSMFESALAGQNGQRDLWSWNRVFGIGGSSDVQGSYLDKDILFMNSFYGAATYTMSTNKTILDNAFNEAIIKIISGQKPIDDFESVVQAWYDGGGEKITQEVNEWYEDHK